MSASDAPPVTLETLRRMKADGVPIAALTCYDASFAALLDAAGVDLLLVGDSLGMVVQGHASTLPVTLDDMVYHTRAVGRARRRPLLMADLPFLSYATPERALDAAGRLMAEGGAEVVKLEGGRAQAATITRLAEQGVPVCAHLGLQPQSVHKLGGYRVQGREAAAAERLREDAALLEAAGADLLVLECVPRDLAAEITARAAIPVIGIGAGPDCDGQVLVLYDLLGLTPGRLPRFVQRFLTDGRDVPAALAAFVAAVRERRFPAPEQSYG